MLGDAQLPARADTRNSEAGELFAGEATRRGTSGRPASGGLVRHAATIVGEGWRIAAGKVTLGAFVDPLRGLQPTVLLAGQGYSPVERRIVLTAVMHHGSAPYGEQMVIAIPAIPTLPLEPDASLVTLSPAERPVREPAARVIATPCGCLPPVREAAFPSLANSSTPTAPRGHPSRRRPVRDESLSQAFPAYSQRRCFPTPCSCGPALRAGFERRGRVATWYRRARHEPCL